MAVQSDNKVIIGGGSSSGYVLRLNADGSLENTFTNFSTGPNGPVYAVALQPDGKIIIGGSFTSFNGTGKNRIARLDADGWLDPSFLYGMTGVSGTVYAAQVQPDGKILVAGTFSSVNNTTRYAVARLTSSGALDTGFATAAQVLNSGATVNALALQPDGSIVVGGYFSAYTPSYNSYNIARLYADGTMDIRFQSPNSYFSPTYALALQEDGRSHCGRDFHLPVPLRLSCPRLWQPLPAGVHSATHQPLHYRRHQSHAHRPGQQPHAYLLPVAQGWR